MGIEAVQASTKREVLTGQLEALKREQGYVQRRLDAVGAGSVDPSALATWGDLRLAREFGKSAQQLQANLEAIDVEIKRVEKEIEDEKARLRAAIDEELGEAPAPAPAPQKAKATTRLRRRPADFPGDGPPVEHVPVPVDRIAPK
jgi:hypothetical protein